MHNWFVSLRFEQIDNNMERKELFEKFIEDCRKAKQICGAGNPNANILLVGQEHYSPKPIINEEDWNSYLNDNYRYCKERTTWVVDNKSKTWYYYQKLVDKSIGRETKRSKTKDFEEFAFTTELNNEAKPSSRIEGENKTQRKEKREQLHKRIAQRLQLFKHSDFIQSFPVIVLACGPYIVNRKEKGLLQTNDTFNVIFDEDQNEQGVPKGWHKNGKMWFATHHNPHDPTKLVIHTCQLSRADKDLLDEMANVINEHLHRFGYL